MCVWASAFSCPTSPWQLQGSAGRRVNYIQLLSLSDRDSFHPGKATTLTAALTVSHLFDSGSCFTSSSSRSPASGDGHRTCECVTHGRTHDSQGPNGAPPRGTKRMNHRAGGKLTAGHFLWGVGRYQLRADAFCAKVTSVIKIHPLVACDPAARLVLHPGRLGGLLWLAATPVGVEGEWHSPASE